MRRNLDFHLQLIRFGIIRFSSVRIPKLRYSVFRYFTRFGRSLPNFQNSSKIMDHDAKHNLSIFFYMQRKNFKNCTPVFFTWLFWLMRENRLYHLLASERQVLEITSRKTRKSHTTLRLKFPKCKNQQKNPRQN